MLRVALLFAVASSGVSLAAAQDREPAGKTCVFVAADPELRDVELDSSWVRADGFGICRVRGTDRWVVDYLWGRVPSRPGVLFGFSQLDSLAAEGVIQSSTIIGVATYRTSVWAAGVEQALRAASERRPQAPPEALVAAVKSEMEPGFETAAKEFAARREVVAHPAERQPWGAVPLGTGPETLASWEGIDDDLGKIAFAMVGFDGSIHVYDFGHRNIKRLARMGSDDCRTTVIPGIDARPRDGTVGPDGTIYLLVDGEANGEPLPARVRVDARPPGGSSWVESEPLGDAIGHAWSIVSMPEGNVYVCEYAGRAVLVARGNRLLRAEERVASDTNPPCIGLHPNPDRRQIALHDGRRFDAEKLTRCIGCDATGHTYRMTFDGEGTFTIGKCDSTGVLECAMLVEQPRSAWQVGGKGRFAILPDGTLLEFSIDETRLVISSLSCGRRE